MASVRSSSLAWVNNTNSCTIALPAGSAAGDLCILNAEHAFSVGTPSGWTSLQNIAGANTNGGTSYKVLTAGDISAGSVTVNFASSSWGTVILVSLIVTTDILKGSNAFRDSAGAGSRSIVSPSVLSGDLLLWFSGGVGNVGVTCDQGTVQQTNSAVNASAALYASTASATGTITGTFTYSSAPSGDYGSVVAVGLPQTGLLTTKAEVGAWIDPYPGLITTKAEVGAWIDPQSGLITTKAEVGAWIDVIPYRRRNALRMGNPT